jgi:hypothetical protein
MKNTNSIEIMPHANDREDRDRLRSEDEIAKSLVRLEQTATAGIKAKANRDAREYNIKNLKDNRESLAYENASPVQILIYTFAIALLPILIGTSMFLNHDAIEAMVGKHNPKSLKEMVYWLTPVGTSILAICVKTGENFADRNNKPTGLFKVFGWLLLAITPIFTISIFTIKPITLSSSLLTLGKILLITVPELLVLYCGELILVSLGFFLYQILLPYYQLRANWAGRELNTNTDRIRTYYPADRELVTAYNSKNPERSISLGRFSGPTTKFINQAMGLEEPTNNRQVPPSPATPKVNNDPNPQPPVNNQPSAPNPDPAAAHTQAPPANPAPTPAPAPPAPEVNNDLEEYYRNQAAAMVRKAEGEVQP